MSIIFLSYSRESQDIVKTLANDIEDLGHDSWFDQDLTGGQDWWDQILDRISKCNIFVYALTPEALESHACKLELDYAYKLNKTILPILVADGVSTNLLPTALSAIQFVDYRHKDKQAAFAVNKAINNLPAPQPLPEPLPKPPAVPTSYLGNLKDQIETTGTLSFEEQSALVLKLEEDKSNIDNTNDVRNLLERLRNRDDLFAKVAAKIDNILTSITRPSPEPNPIPKTRTNTIPLTTDKSEHPARHNPWLRWIAIIAILVAGFWAGFGMGVLIYDEFYNNFAAWSGAIPMWVGSIVLAYFVWRWLR